MAKFMREPEYWKMIRLWDSSEGKSVVENVLTYIITTKYEGNYFKLIRI